MSEVEVALNGVDSLFPSQPRRFVKVRGPQKTRYACRRLPVESPKRGSRTPNSSNIRT
jgi:hypothetical protein